jgi:hypothetical protein
MLADKDRRQLTQHVVLQLLGLMVRQKESKDAGDQGHPENRQ